MKHAVSYPSSVLSGMALGYLCELRLISRVKKRGFVSLLHCDASQ